MRVPLPPYLGDAGLDAGEIDDGPVDLLNLDVELVDGDLKLLALLLNGDLGVDRRGRLLRKI